MTHPAESLSFSTLDDLALAAQRGRLNTAALSGFLAEELGPFVELCQMVSSGLFNVCADSIVVIDDISRLHAQLKRNIPYWVSSDGTSGFYRTLPNQPDHTWTQFQIAAERAAVLGGFNEEIGKQLVGAIGELVDNIHLHSENVQSGLIVFRARPEWFEFVISDQGIGLMKSLQSCPEYRNVADEGDALKLCLSDGVSRYGANSNHGWGFRPLFVGLANLWGFLRFRSGNHALTIDGQTPALVRARIAEKPPIDGFLAAVSCRKQAA